MFKTNIYFFTQKTERTDKGNEEFKKTLHCCGSSFGYPAPFGKHLEERTWYTYKIKKSDGGRKTAYCIQYGVPASTTTDFNHQTTYGKLNATEKKLLRRALIFGYNDKTGPLYGGSWLDNAMATQAMVWIITSGQRCAASQ